MKLTFRIPSTRRDAPIVMVDDEELDIEAAARGLRRSSLDNEFLSFNDGQPFLDYLDGLRGHPERYPAVVMLDINMPLMSGLEVLSAVRKDSEFRDVPIITMLTSSTHDADMLRAQERGANDYLIKPADYNEYVTFFDELFDSA